MVAPRRVRLSEQYAVGRGYLVCAVGEENFAQSGVGTLCAVAACCVTLGTLRIATVAGSTNRVESVINTETTGVVSVGEQVVGWVLALETFCAEGTETSVTLWMTVCTCMVEVVVCCLRRQESIRLAG